MCLEELQVKMKKKNFYPHFQNILNVHLKQKWLLNSRAQICSGLATHTYSLLPTLQLQLQHCRGFASSCVVLVFESDHSTNFVLVC